ncbi:glycoside hydrolase 15 protein [Quaeritorhiza haematococci]|nr:glycoside hydrolase 15 protein [Quaeritorhiza haematococci]
MLAKNPIAAIFVGAVAFSSPVFALPQGKQQQPPQPPSSRPIPLAADINQWLAEQVPFSTQAMLDNINVPGSVPGTVVAATTRENPPYFFHWVRDGALVLDTVVTMYKETTNPDEKARFEQLLFDYAALSRRQQLEKGCEPIILGQCEGLGGPGDVKYNIDGTLFRGSWGRLQNDGPGLRASTLVRFANAFLEKGGDINVIREKLYDAVLPTNSVVKVDLEYVAHHWQDQNFDLWEEVKGQHFFTKMVQRRGLLEGAAFAESMGDPGAAGFYREQAKALESAIDLHWNAQGNFIREIIDFDPNTHTRDGRNVGTVLAVIHGYNNDGFYSPTNERVLASAERLRQDFEAEYNIAKTKVDDAGLPIGTPYGRYKEDVYDGSMQPGSKGNPWFLATLAVAQMYYQAIDEYNKVGTISITPVSLPFFQGLNIPNAAAGATFTKGSAEFDGVINSLAENADMLIRRVKYHVGPTRRMAEQYSREHGFQLSAENLTWSYASVLTLNNVRRHFAA